jgi:hypothetical protein
MPQVPTTNRDKAQDAPNAWEEGATIEEWAPFYFDANKLLATLRARAECVVPREAWAAHVAAASKKKNLPAPEAEPDPLHRWRLILGRRLQHVNCVVLSTLTPSLDVEVEEIHYSHGRKQKVYGIQRGAFAVMPSTSPAQTSVTPTTMAETPSAGEGLHVKPPARVMSALIKRRERNARGLRDAQTAPVHVPEGDAEDGAEEPGAHARFEPLSPGPAVVLVSRDDEGAASPVTSTANVPFGSDNASPVPSGGDALHRAGVAERMGTSFSDQPPHMKEADLREAVRAAIEFNEELSAMLKEHVHDVTEFYRRTTTIVSAGAAACIDHCKRFSALTKKQRAQVEKTIHQTAFSMSMLQEYCDKNFLAIQKFVLDAAGVSHQRIDVGTSLMQQPFFMTRQKSSIVMLREMLVDYYAEHFCGDDRAEANARIRRFSDPDDGLEEVHNIFRLDRPTQMAIAGLVSGILAALMVTVVTMYAGHQFHLEYVAHSQHAAYLFSISGVPILFALLFTLNVAMWERYKVNFAFSFNLHPFRHFTSLSIFIQNGTVAIMWLLCAFFYLRAASIEYSGLEASLAVSALNQCRDTVTGAAASPGCSTVLANDTSAQTAQQIVAFLSVPLENGRSKATIPAYLWPYLAFPLAFVVLVVGRIAKLLRGQPSFFFPSLLRVMLTPYYHVTFADFFVCEQLVSLGDVLFEWQFFFCAFDDVNSKTGHFCREGRALYVGVLAALPVYFRIAQSFRRYYDNPDQRGFYPHLLCATKYGASLVRIGVSVYAAVAFRGQALAKHKITADEDTTFVWYNERAVLAAIISFCIVYAIETVLKLHYELWIEFHVFQRTTRHKFLRDIILYPPIVYYVAIVVNFLFRWLWIIKFLIVKFWYHDDPAWVFPVFAVLEVIRRIVWNSIRVETDQVDNTENYKAVQIAPLMAMPHANPSVDWQLTYDDVNRRFEALGDENAPLIVQNDAISLPDSSSSGGPRLMTKAAEFFDLLSATERIEVLRTILPPEEFPTDDVATMERGGVFFRLPRGNGTRRLPPKWLFHALHEEDKVRALLLRVGKDRTIAEYYAEVVESHGAGAENVKPDSAPARGPHGDATFVPANRSSSMFGRRSPVRRSSSILRRSGAATALPGSEASPTDAGSGPVRPLDTHASDASSEDIVPLRLGGPASRSG